jgi:hypothetical protein
MEEKPKTNRDKLKRVLHGAAGISKSLMRINKAPDDIIEKRLSLCKKCEFAIGPKLHPDRKVKCNKCGCLINHKIRLKESFCPINKWGIYLEK